MLVVYSAQGGGGINSNIPNIVMFQLRCQKWYLS